MNKQLAAPSSPLISVPRLEDWLNQALPIYLNAYHAFMSVVKEKKTHEDEVVVECNAFYEALQITRSLFNDPLLLQEIKTTTPPFVLGEIEVFIPPITQRLDEIHQRCIEVEGETCIAPEDFFAFIRLLGEIISEIGKELSSLIMSAVEPFNDFIRDFDASATINLINGDYHVLLSQEAEELKSKTERLFKENLKLQNVAQATDRNDTPEVYVVCENQDLIHYVTHRWAKQIHLTKHAKDSILDSPYKDLKKLIQAFDLLGNEFCQAYTSNIRMHEASQAAESINIEFKPSMSDTTMGKHQVYDRQYKDKPADFNKHLCLGTSRKPEHCYRIHFDWDEEDQQIVIHHAGKHLPVGND